MTYKKYLPIIAAIIYSTIFGFSFMFSKIGLDVMTTVELIAFRFLLSAIVMYILKTIKVIKINLKGKKLNILLLTCICEPVLYFLFETMGIQLTSSSEAGLMISLIPVFVAILSFIFLKEQLNSKQIIFILLSVFGVIFINLMKDGLTLSGNYLGIIFLLLAILSSALYNIGSKKSSEQFTPIEITYVMMWIAAIVFNIMLLLENISTDNMQNYFQALLNIKALTSLLYLGVLSSIIAFFMVNFTISKISVTQASIFSNISTIISILAGIFILNETFYWYHLVGSMIIIIGVWGTMYFGNK